MKKIFISLTFVLAITSIFAQQEVDSTPKVAFDTVQSGRFDIVLFDNNTWEYVNHDSVMALIHLEDSVNVYAYILREKLYTPDSLTIFSEKWDTVNIFAYGNIDYKRALDTFAIPILGDTGRFVIPVPGYKQSGFGWRWGQMHNGIDLDLQTGDTVVSAFDGVVRFAGWNNGGYGYLVIVRHFNGLETYYAHLNALNCTDNQRVSAGECIGFGGRTGRAYGPHLHFEIRFRDNPFDPEWLIDFESKELKTDILYLMPEKFGHVKEVAGSQYHVVQSGDSLWGISRRYGVSINYICSLNGITEGTTLNIGQRLRVR
ncbi:MAG: peptidoglycan DD-metalloendopeptidase family protein [Bacteroidales bacterium]|nr:peptidoglycan DD-metalloendopeptidase family protein [Bacteroidales bacterium]